MSTRAEPEYRRTSLVASALTGAALVTVSGAAPAWAHAFGARYDLPLPLDFWMIGAAAVVALSFVIMAFFILCFSGCVASRPRYVIDESYARPLDGEYTTSMFDAATGETQ